MTEHSKTSASAVDASQTPRKIQILDGGMSRELIRLNAPFSQPEWSAQALLEAPHMVQQVHCEFAAAGADIITTNSYALVPFHIGENRFWERGEELAALAGRLARAAAHEEMSRSGRNVLVAGSLPPIFGSYRPDLFRSSEVQKYLEVLVRGLAPYVDVWLGETLSLIAEAEAVVSAVEGGDKPIWISYNLEDNPEKDVGADTEIGHKARLRSGETVSDAAVRASELGASALLFNCNRPELMKQAICDAKIALEESGPARAIPIGVYANAFEPRADEYAANENVSPIRSDLESQAYAKMAQEWVDSGATMVGGCCGIGVAHIREIAKVLGRADATDQLNRVTT